MDSEHKEGEAWRTTGSGLGFGIGAKERETMTSKALAMRAKGSLQGFGGQGRKRGLALGSKQMGKGGRSHVERAEQTR